MNGDDRSHPTGTLPPPANWLSADGPHFGRSSLSRSAPDGQDGCRGGPSPPAGAGRGLGGCQWRQLGATLVDGSLAEAALITSWGEYLGPAGAPACNRRSGRIRREPFMPGSRLLGVYADQMARIRRT